MNDEFTTAIERRPLATTIDYYAERLAEHEKALTFLRRNLLSADAALKVGFADRSLGKRCLRINRVKESSCASSCKARAS